MPSKKHTDFEKNLERLSQIVQTMEKGELSLEQSLTAFEDGIKIAKQCQKVLNEAEQKVQVLVEKNDEIFLEDFDLLEDEDLSDD